MLNVSNLVSFEVQEAAVSVVKIATFLTINAKSSADALSSGSFTSKSADSFPLEFPVVFKAENDGDPNKKVTFRFDFGDGSSFNAISTDVSGIHTYLSTGEFNVTVTMEHQFGELTNTTRITTKESLTGLTISDDAPTVVNEITTFTLKWNTLGTDTVIEVHVGDGEKIVLGDNINNVEPSSRAIFRTIDPAEKSITFTHTYKAISIFVVTVNGWNNVSSIMLSHRTVNVEEECRYPEPVILGLGADPQTAPSFDKDREIHLHARVVIECKTSYETVFEWKAYNHTCSNSDNNSTPIMIDTNLNTPSLIIPPHSLPHGPICLKFMAKMKYFIDAIDSSAEGYINVIPGKLKAQILGGTFRTVSSQRPIIIDGSISEDTDIKGGNLSGVQFYWFCRRINETSRRGVKKINPVTFANASLNSNDYSCEGSVPRMLLNEEPIWEISPGVLWEDEIYVVKLVIKRDTREATFEQTIEVVKGVPPQISIG